MELVLVRHAQPDWEPDGRAVDHPALTELGRAQARRCAAALAGESFDALYVSPLRRARETAAPIAEALGLEPRVESWLRELELPPLAGKTEEEVLRFFHSARARHLEKWWEGFPGGESFRHFYERVSSGIEGLLLHSHRLGVHADAGHRIWRVPERSSRLLLVAHEGTHSVILSHLLGIEPVPWAWLRFSISWAGLARLRTTEVAGGAVWVLRSFNQAHHLDGLEIS
ncbi:MAG: histidine phosphatase family protein [Myxococcota bacterium]